jgi:hypothetical protein
MVTTRIMYFNIKEIRIFQTGCLEIFLMIPTLNIYYFLEDNWGM